MPDDELEEALQEDLNPDSPAQEEPEEEDVLEEVGDETKSKLKAAQTAAEKLGVMEWAKGKAVEVLKNQALSIYKEAREKPSSRYGKLMAVWEDMTDEGREAFLKDNTFLSQIAWESITPMTISVPRTMYRFFKSHTLPAEYLELKDFNKPQEVRKLAALGILKCSEEAARTVDLDANHTLKVLKFIGVLATFIPEVGPVIAEGVEEGAQFAEYPAKLAEQLLPAVRAEVRKEVTALEAEKMAVPVTQKEKHDEVAVADGEGGVEVEA